MNRSCRSVSACNARQTDLFVEDVQCSSVLWFADRKCAGGGFRPKIVGVVDVAVPFPLLRAVFKAFPGPTATQTVWDAVMPPVVEDDNSKHNCISDPSFERELKSKRDAIIPKHRLVGKESKRFTEFAVEVSHGVPSQYHLLSILRDRPKPNLAKIVVDTDVTNGARKRYDVAAWRLQMAKHYSKLFGAYTMVFQGLDLRNATLSERMAKSIFDDAVAKRIHRRPRSYGWYVLKRYWLPVWTLRNWLWKVVVARKYAPGAPGYLQDLEDLQQNGYEFVDDGIMTIVVDDDDDAMLGADQMFTQLDWEFRKILGKREREG